MDERDKERKKRVNTGASPSSPEPSATSSSPLRLSVHFLLLCDSWHSILSAVAGAVDVVLVLFPCRAGISALRCDEVCSVAIMTETAAGEPLYSLNPPAGCCDASMLRVQIGCKHNVKGVQNNHHISNCITSSHQPTGFTGVCRKPDVFPRGCSAFYSSLGWSELQSAETSDSRDVCFLLNGVEVDGALLGWAQSGKKVWSVVSFQKAWAGFFRWCRPCSEPFQRVRTTDALSIRWQWWILTVSSSTELEC